MSSQILPAKPQTQKSKTTFSYPDLEADLKQVATLEELWLRTNNPSRKLLLRQFIEGQQLLIRANIQGTVTPNETIT